MDNTNFVIISIDKKEFLKHNYIYNTNINKFYHFLFNNFDHLSIQNVFKYYYRHY